MFNALGHLRMLATCSHVQLSICKRLYTFCGSLIMMICDNAVISVKVLLASRYVPITTQLLTSFYNRQSTNQILCLVLYLLHNKLWFEYLAMDP